MLYSFGRMDVIIVMITSEELRSELDSTGAEEQYPGLRVYAVH
jgi:hypothetical protein